MANDKNTNGVNTGTTNSGCCGGTEGKTGFGVMADLFTETMQNVQASNQKMLDVWTKGFATDNGVAGTFAKRGVSFQNGVTEMTTRFMTESTKVGVDQLNAINQAWQRSFEAMMGVTTKGRKADAVVEVTRDIVNDTVNATSKNTERLVRLGLDSAQGMTGLVDETLTAVAGTATKRSN